MVFVLPESCTQETVSEIWRRELPKTGILKAGDEVELDADGVRFLDGAGEALLVEFYRRAAEQGFSLSCRDKQGVVARTLARFPVSRFQTLPAVREMNRNTKTTVQLGKAAVGIWENICGQMSFLGESAVSAVCILLTPRRLRWRDMLLDFERAGIDALPITILIGFLLGLILAFMSATSLRQFGVEVFVADLIAIGLFRELGPIITAIILAGRSGSAFAAEIGTMKVNEEIDALTTMGLPPVSFLALPRILAAMLVMPPLAIFSILAGLIGGSFVLLSMDIPAIVYWQRVMASTSLSNVLFGLGKSMVFGLLVGLIGCFYGLNTGRTADAVGRAATASVVGSLIMITVFDGAFAVMAYFTGI